MGGCAIVSACRRAHDGAKRGVMRNVNVNVMRKLKASCQQLPASPHVEDTLEADQT